MKQWMRFHIILIMTYLIVVANATGQEIIRLGTLASEGSTWGKIFKQMDTALRQKSHDRIQFRFHFNLGETDSIALMERGQLDAVALTATGLGEVLPEIFIFQLPMLFSTDEELDCVRAVLTSQFSEMFERKGYTFLGWSDVGFIYIFSKEPIKTQTDLQKTRFWVWETDPIGKAFASRSGREPILLPIQRVSDALKKDIIQTVYASPLGLIALGWHPQIAYMSDLRLAAGVGAIIFRKRRFDQLSDNHQRLLQEITATYHKRLIDQIRKDNERSIDALKQAGIQVLPVPYRERQQWLEVAREVQDQFVGDLYSEALFLEVKSALEECRQKMRNGQMSK